MNCPHCGKAVSNEDAIYCPFCSKQLQVIKKRTGFPIAAGVLTVIASCLSIIIAVGAFLTSSSYYWFSYAVYVAGFLGLLAFAFGITAGILTLRRRYFPLTIIGISIILVSGVVTSIVLIGGGLLFGLPSIVLSVLSIIFVAISKAEFN